MEQGLPARVEEAEMPDLNNLRIIESALWGGYSRPGTPNSVQDCYFQRACNDPEVTQLWAYTGDMSYGPEASVDLHVNTTSDTYDIMVFRDGADPVTVFSRQGVAGRFHPTPEDCSVNGCNWPVALEIPLAQDWPSGAYVVRLSATLGDGRLLTYSHIFFLRPGAGDKTGRLLLVAATGTWTAYNDWGGSNHYEGITGPDQDQFSPSLSHARPFAPGFVTLPADAPRIPLRDPPAMGAEVTYPHMDWAYVNGYSKKYASAGWASYERPFVHWLERAGYDVDIVAQHDLQTHPELVDGYACLSFVGHDEYWSWEMRDTVEAYVEQGGNIARFAGNFFWQTRIKHGGRTQICYKSRAREHDPLRNSDRITTLWDAPQTTRPGAQTFGLSGTFGLYAGWGGCAPRGAGGFTIYRPDHWVFEGTDLYYGDVLGAPSRIFGYEVDGVDYVIKDGLPFATGSDGAPDNLNILGMGIATVFEADHGGENTLFIGADDTRFVATARYGKATPETMERCKRGSGMIALFDRGQGNVFTAGTCEWVAGLIDHDPQVEKVTRNVLDRFLRR
jgi:N,N-dimethylformamidase beta subunit-like, C-terminal